jgi:hypothetical protein
LVPPFTLNSVPGATERIWADIGLVRQMLNKKQMQLNSFGILSYIYQS